MSSGSTDFGSYAVGSAPSGWTPQWVTSGGSWVVREAPDSLSGKVLVPEFDSGARRAISWDEVPAVKEIEVLALVRATAPRAAGLTTNRIVIQGGGGAGAEVGMFTTAAGSTHTLNAYLPTEGSVLIAAIQPADDGSLARYWVRLKHELADTDNIYHAKVWAFGTTEPGDGAVVPLGQTNGERSTLAAGWAGLGTFTPDSGTAFEFFSYSTDATPPPLPGEPTDPGGVGGVYALEFPTVGQIWPNPGIVRLKRTDPEPTQP